MEFSGSISIKEAIMQVQIIATRQCSHRANLEHELNDLGIGYEVVFVEENLDLLTRYQIRHSPNLVVDGRVVCRGQPTEAQLHDLFMKPA